MVLMEVVVHDDNEAQNQSMIIARTDINFIALFVQKDGSP